MALFNNQEAIEKIAANLTQIREKMGNPIIFQAYEDDFTRRFCWSSNALEGNTLSLEETIDVIDYDEVRGGHTFSEYREAKNLYDAISSLMIPLQKRSIDEAWIKEANAKILQADGAYRKKAVYIGTAVEAVYFPPKYSEVPERMKQYIETLEEYRDDMKQILQKIAKDHMTFERIHPFPDGNGRTGRMILNQQLINVGLLPIVLKSKGSYRQAFRRYDRNEDLSQMVHLICQEEFEAMDRVNALYDKWLQQTQKQIPERKPVKKR